MGLTTAEGMVVILSNLRSSVAIELATTKRATTPNVNAEIGNRLTGTS
jgi:hypothetical protein